jgi:5-methylcytosine-specific restriction endonuclease McrA
MEVVSWERAFTLLYEGKVEVVTEYEDRQVRTVNMTFKMPAVIRFIKRMRTHKRAIKFSRQNVYARDQGRCQYCGSKVRRDVATYDHVVPRSKGGHTRWENIVIACVDCNQNKRDRTPEQSRMKLRSTPVKPNALPSGGSFTLTYRKGMPPEWKAFLTDMAYWEGELESDE